MKKLQNCLKMLLILKSGKVVKVEDLAIELDVSSKQIERYKKVLEEFFVIESKPGPKGGYKLLDSHFPFRELLTNDEIQNLKSAIREIDKELIECNSTLEKAISKINHSILNNAQESSIDSYMIPYSRVKSNNIGKIKDNLSKAIIDTKEVIISYRDNNGYISRRTVHPYLVFRFKSEYYLVAMCLLRNEIRYFKLIRILEYIVTSRDFIPSVNINEIMQNHRTNSIGIFGGEEYDLLLEISPPMSNTIQERIWVDNQQITELGNGKINFKAKMKGGPEIISWILSMGDSVKIISPNDLKEKVEQRIIKMLNNLKKI